APAAATPLPAAPVCRPLDRAVRRRAARVAEDPRHADPRLRPAPPGAAETQRSRLHRRCAAGRCDRGQGRLSLPRPAGSELRELGLKFGQLPANLREFIGLAGLALRLALRPAVRLVLVVLARGAGGAGE